MATKINKTTFNSFEEVDAKLLVYGRNEIELKKSEAQMNEEIQAITDKYDGLTKFRREQNIAIEAGVKAFCEAHKDEFDKQRTKKLTFGKVGFRTATESLVPLNKKFKWDYILFLLKDKWKRKFVRMVEAPDKELLLREYRAGKVTDKDLSLAGLRVEQGEGFVLKLDWKKIETN